MSYVQTIADAFGGSRQLAKGLGYPESTVRSWCERGKMTDPQKIMVMQLAIRMGVPLTPADFFPDQDLVAAHFRAPVSPVAYQKDVA